MKAVISATSDIFIKYLLGSENNKDLLLSFINAVLEDSEFKKITYVEIKNPFNIKNFKGEKETILDVKATDEAGRQYDIEVQAFGEPGFESRSLYYWAKLYSSQLKEGELYPKLKPVICINVLDLILFDKPDNYHSCFVLMDRHYPEYMLTDHLALHFLELPKIKDEFRKDKLYKWLLFFKNEGKKEDLMEILLKDDPDFAKAHNEYGKFTQDDELIDLYEAREKWKKDYNTAIYYARKEGQEEGGIREKQNVLIRIIKNKFGITDQESDLIKSTDDTARLDAAIDRVVTAEAKGIVIKDLGRK